MTSGEKITDLSHFNQQEFSKDNPPSDDLMAKMVAFDQKCFASLDKTTSDLYGPPTATSESIQHDLDYRNQFLVFTNQSGELACVVQYFIKGKPPKEQELHIMSIAINVPYRGSGMSKLVLDKLYQIVKEQKLDLVTLRVDPLNIPALVRYLKDGFFVVGARSKSLGEGYENVTTLAASKRLSISPVFVADAPIKLIYPDDLGAITDLTEQGYLGTEISQDLLVMRRQTEESRDLWARWQ